MESDSVVLRLRSFQVSMSFVALREKSFWSAILRSSSLGDLEILPTPNILLICSLLLFSVWIEFFDNLNWRVSASLNRFSMSAFLLYLVLHDFVFAIEPSLESFVFAGTRCRRAIVAIMLKLLRIDSFARSCKSMLSWLANICPALFFAENEKRRLQVHNFDVFSEILLVLSFFRGARSKGLKVGWTSGLLVLSLIFGKAFRPTKTLEVIITID